jgi:hypothetical protein
MSNQQKAEFVGDIFHIQSLWGDCDRTTSKMKGFVSQDHIGGFPTKRECANTHEQAYNTKYEIQVKVITD